ncbi:MAG: right-handed parallel beta-helix repeat-containing protein [Kiritimatiellae bacterium]|nr:right-handed parallel beta-helix repeat-containing protein [Kiritimatiellia bacterium]
MKKLVLAVAAVAAGVVNAVAEPAVLPASMYVQDGLVLMVDGIENAGPGQHDPAATQLVDLSGSGAVQALADGEEVREKSFLLKSGHQFTGLFARLGGMPKESLSLESVSHPWPKNGSSWAYAYNAIVVDAAYFGSICYDTRSDGGMSTYYKTSWATSSQNRRYHYIASSPHGGIANHIKASAAPLCTSVRFKANSGAAWIENASRTLRSFWDGNPTAYEDYVTIGNDKEYTEVYCVRVYNRELTDGEREQNYLIDRNRFFGEPIPGDKRLVVSIPDQKFDGIHPVTPVPKVTDLLTGKELEAGVDYEYVADGTGALGTGSCTVTGKGEYAGCESVTPFKVVSAYGAGKILYVSPDADDSADEDCLTFATAGTLSNACSRATAGTAAAPTVIVLLSGTAEEPAVYDYSGVVKSEGQYTFAIVSKDYVTIRSMDLNPTNCIVRGGGQAQDLRCLSVGAKDSVLGITFEKFAKLGHSTGDQGASYGMGAAIWAAAGTTISNCIFRGNFGTNVGAVRYGNCTDCLFVGNSNEKGSGWHVGAAGLYTSGKAKNCTFIGNTCFGESGALSLVNQEGPVADNCLFVSNAGANASYVYSNTQPVLTNCVYRENQCTAACAGSLYRCQIIGNSYSGGSTADSVGAAGANGVVAYDCLFKDNAATATDKGGGAHVKGGTYYRCIFEGGSSTKHNYSCVFSGANNATAGFKFYDCIIRNADYPNKTIYRGFIMDGCVISNVTFGGGLSLSYGAEMRNTVIAGNVCSNTLLTANSGLCVDNCLIVGNRSVQENPNGRTPLITYCNLRNCTVADNVCCSSGSTAAVGFWNLSLNSVFYGNTPYDIDGWAAGNPSTMTNCTYGTIDSAEALRGIGNFQLKKDPFLAGADAKHPWGYRPRPGKSGVVDKGFYDPAVYETITTDLGGNPRIFGKGVDIGCYEWQGPYPGLLLMVK